MSPFFAKGKAKEKQMLFKKEDLLYMPHTPRPDSLLG